MCIPALTNLLMCDVPGNVSVSQFVTTKLVSPRDEASARTLGVLDADG